MTINLENSHAIFNLFFSLCDLIIALTKSSVVGLDVLFDICAIEIDDYGPFVKPSVCTRWRCVMLAQLSSVRQRLSLKEVSRNEGRFYMLTGNSLYFMVPFRLVVSLRDRQISMSEQIAQVLGEDFVDRKLSYSKAGSGVRIK